MAKFNPALKKFLHGRKAVFDQLSSKIKAEDKLIWFHAASLGEFEQGLPVMEACKNSFPDYKILLTFFSPSGYEIRKTHPIADIITYLPIDTKANAARFVALTKPKMAVFIKYEFWPNYLKALHRAKVSTIVVSAVFRKRQIFFKPYGSWMRKRLNAFDHFFVQDQISEKLLQSIGQRAVTISGDTRFDRVDIQLKQNNHLAFAEKFKENNLCVVAGSTWPEDETLLINYINRSQGVRFIIAPHKIEVKKISALKTALEKTSVLYSELDQNAGAKADVLIIDTIGLLTKLYSYADIAYVGGAVGHTGLHNTLEPAAFGIPIIIGQHYKGFPEAETLVRLNGFVSVKNQQSLNKTLDTLISYKALRTKMGTINREYTQKQKGATEKIMRFLISRR